MSMQTTRDESENGRPDLEEYVREHEDDYREIAAEDEKLRPLIEAMLEDVLEEGED